MKIHKSPFSLVVTRVGSVFQRFETILPGNGSLIWRHNGAWKFWSEMSYCAYLQCAAKSVMRVIYGWYRCSISHI